jgi:hypothetical protein
LAPPVQTLTAFFCQKNPNKIISFYPFSSQNTSFSQLSDTNVVKIHTFISIFLTEKSCQSLDWCLNFSNPFSGRKRLLCRECHKLGVALMNRFSQTGGMDDLEELIRFHHLSMKGFLGQKSFEVENHR